MENQETVNQEEKIEDTIKEKDKYDIEKIEKAEEKRLRRRERNLKLKGDVV